MDGLRAAGYGLMNDRSAHDISDADGTHPLGARGLPSPG
jgi:hypothetical protein